MSAVVIPSMGLTSANCLYTAVWLPISAVLHCGWSMQRCSENQNMCASVGDDEECENSSFRIFWYITGSTATGLIDHHWHR